MTRYRVPELWSRVIYCEFPAACCYWLGVMPLSEYRQLHVLYISVTLSRFGLLMF